MSAPSRKLPKSLEHQLSRSVGFLAVASVCCAVMLGAGRSLGLASGVFLTMVGGSLLNILLKHFFHRQRPVLENPLVTLTSFGFPSGHTMGATLFFTVCSRSWPRSL